MKESEMSSLAKRFSHIYIEEEAVTYPLTQALLARFPEAVLIPIDHYKDVFNPGGQNFLLQKEATSLILAVNHGELLYPGARFCQSFGHEHFYYCSNLYNCVYDCEYCYLQGMYPSANIVVFVNYEDYFARVEEMLAQFPLYLCISYDTDLLAMEKWLGLCRKWVDFTRCHPGLTIEIRTKSALNLAQAELPVCDRVIYAWTLSTEYITGHYEHKTPSLESRLAAVSRAQALGHPVRLCFDPLIRYPALYDDLPAFYRKVFASVDPDRILDASLGVFRISTSYLKSMRRKRSGAITAYPYSTENGIATYDREYTDRIQHFARSELLHYLPADKIFEPF